MAMLKFLVVFLACCSSVGADCKTEHWISRISQNGDFVVLENQSIWQITHEQNKVILWELGDSILTCDDRLINTDEHEAVSAYLLRRESKLSVFP